MKKALFLLLFLCHYSFSQKEIKGNYENVLTVKENIGFALHVPKDVQEKKPLIVFIPGDGEKGKDLERVKIHGPFKYLKTHELDCYILAPQCLENQNWNIDLIYKLIKTVQEENNIDPNRIYLTGLSSGGWATWNLGIEHPELFAALVPISSFVDLIQMDYICKVAAIPTQIYHGLQDDLVKVDYAIDAYAALKKCNANVKLTIFDDANHDSWTRVYDNPGIYDWMFQQVKKNK